MDDRRQRERDQDASLQDLLHKSWGSKAFGCIQLPADFGNISSEELTGQYERACMNIPRAHLDAATTGEYKDVAPHNAQPLEARPVRANASAGLQGAQRAAQFLFDQLHYLKALIREVHHVQDILTDAFGGFCTDELNTFELAQLDLSLPVRLTPLGAYYLRGMVRFRFVQVDFEFVSGLIEQILDGCGQVCRGTLIPAMDMSRKDLDDLRALWRSWESVYLEISLDFAIIRSGLSGSTLFWVDQETMRQSKKFNNGQGWSAGPTSCWGRPGP